MGWIIYAGDNQERLVPNFSGDRVRGTSVKNWEQNWVDNQMNWELDPANTNTAFACAAKLSPYASSSPALYACPNDHVLSAIQRKSGWNGRVRSISMNGMVGDAGPSLQNGLNVNNPDYIQFLKLSGIPEPGKIFVLLDEHPDSVNDGYFLNVADSFEWVDLPSSYHNGAAGFSFADGRVEPHRWKK